MSLCMAYNNAYPKNKIIFTCLLRYFVYSMVVIRFLLFLSGDVELSPGPPLNYTQFTTLMKKYNNQVKFLHQNRQCVLGQRLLLKNFLSDLSDNCISGFSETWLKSVNDNPFWLIYSDYLMSFRCDRRTDLQENNKGGDILLFSRKKFQTKARNDLETMSKDHFESVWVECKISKKPALINLAHCLKKQIINLFLDELTLGLDRATTENKSNFLLGDYNLNYFNCNERNLLETLILPYSLLNSNATLATGETSRTKSLIDYVICEKFLSSQTLDLILKTDHLATLTLIGVNVKNRKEAIKRIGFDKTKYYKNAFSLDVGNINWRPFYLSENPEIMYKIFCSSLETVIKKHAPQKTVSIRHDKPKLTLYQQWISKLQ